MCLSHAKATDAGEGLKTVRPSLALSVREGMRADVLLYFMFLRLRADITSDIMRIETGSRGLFYVQKETQTHYPAKLFEILL